LALPLQAPIALIGLYFTPKSVFGCANRGYLALAVVSVALVGAIVTTLKSMAAKKRGDNDAAQWWIITTLILLSPLALLVGPLG